MNRGAPLVSVIVPVFNVAGQVGAAIASLRAQTLTDFEALVIDDGSTDGSGAVARRAIDADPRFRLIRQDNAGLSAARNAGLDLAFGAFVAFLDGDDCFVPQTLETLYRALVEQGTDWAASAITLVLADGPERLHPAIHGQESPGPMRRIAMDDARQVARVFPSAWNKLVRRTGFDGLRFPVGLWFEDHPVHWALAARLGALAYVPDALVRHRRDRPGQITGTDSDRVFDQLRVLDDLRPRILAGGFTHAEQGFGWLALRLVHERALVITTPQRRARFLTQAAAHLARWQAYEHLGDDIQISRALLARLQGHWSVSVVVLADPSLPKALVQTLAALSAQGMADFEALVIAPPSMDLPLALPNGLPLVRVAPQDWRADLLRGRYVVLFAPGERPTADGLLTLVNLADRTGADLTFGGFSRDDAGYHDGWTDNRAAPELAAVPASGGVVTITGAQALRLFPALGNRCWRAEALPDLPPTPPVALWVQECVLAQSLRAARVACIRLPVARIASPPPLAPDVVGRWAAGLVAPATGLAPGWRAVLYWRQVLRAPRPDWRAALWTALRRGLLAGPLDPEAPRWLRALARRRLPRR